MSLSNAKIDTHINGLAAPLAPAQGIWSNLLTGGGSNNNVLAHPSSFPSGLGSITEDYETVSVHSEPGGRGRGLKCMGHQ